MRILLPFLSSTSILFPLSSSFPPLFPSFPLSFSLSSLRSSFFFFFFSSFFPFLFSFFLLFFSLFLLSLSARRCPARKNCPFLRSQQPKTHLRLPTLFRPSRRMQHPLGPPIPEAHTPEAGACARQELLPSPPSQLAGVRRRMCARDDRTTRRRLAEFPCELNAAPLPFDDFMLRATRL